MRASSGPRVNRRGCNPESIELPVTEVPEVEAVEAESDRVEVASAFGLGGPLMESRRRESFPFVV